MQAKGIRFLNIIILIPVRGAGVCDLGALGVGSERPH